MTPPATKTRKLSTADERREQLLVAAVRVFAERGYHAAPTLEIAKAAGMSQAYLFRLFPTKQELFAAVCVVARKRMLAALREGAERGRAEGVEPLQAMGEAYGALVDRDRDVLLIQLHSNVAAAGEPLIRAAMQKTFGDLYEFVAKESGADAETILQWFATGMLINVMAAIGAETLDDEWAKVLTGHGTPDC